MKFKDHDIILAAIRHKKFIYFILAALIAVGVSGLFKMNRNEFPLFQIKNGLVAAVYPGATAAQVREQVAIPIENALMAFSEVDRYSLKSFSREGICYFYVDLTSPASEKDEVWSKIKHRLNTLKLSLPAGVAAVVVIDDFSETSSVLIALESDDKGNSEMRRYADDLCSELRTIPILANAGVIGAKDEEIAVTVDVDRLSGYGIDPASLMLRYTSASLNVPGGVFSTEYADSPISVGSTVTSEREIGNYIIYADAEGNALRLGDVATIERRYLDDGKSVSYNGNTAVIVNVTMRPGNNIVDFGEEVDAVLARFSENIPDSVHISRITDQPKAVRTSILGFVRDLFISMLVVILVMLMLFPLNSALIAGSGVPVCTAVTLAVMYATGMELNTVTLAALIVVLGMIVDDSIITMDGYMVKLSGTKDRSAAASASSHELFMPMFLATMAISLMFFPCKYIITGYLGDFVRSFPWIIAIALMCSLVYAMFVVPSLEVKYISSAVSHRKGTISRLQTKFFDGMQRIYDKGETICFNHPKLTILSGVVAITLGVLMFLQLNIQMLPKANRDCFAVELLLDSNSSSKDTKELSDSLTKILLKDPRVKSVTAFVGESAPRFHVTYSPSLPGKNIAQLIVNTVSNNATVEILREDEAKYEHIFPNALVHFRQMDYQGTGAIDVQIIGAPVDSLKPLSDSLRKFMYGMSDVLKYIRSDCDGVMSCVDVTLDSDEASRLAVDKTMLSLSLSGTFDGRNIMNLYEGGNKIPVNLYSSNVSDDMTYTDLGSRIIPTMIPGVSVPLSQVASITPSWRYPSLSRLSGEDEISVYAEMKTDCSQPAAMKRIKAYVDREIVPRLPEGATVKYGALSSSNDHVFPEIAWSFLAAVAVLFLFLLIHFRKPGIALLTMALSLLCLFGASLGLWLFNMDFSMTAVLGLISLVGIIVRNGIIMFEYAEQLHSEEGRSIRDAAFLAGQRRMRPIFLTSCTTALGVLPMIFSGDLLWMPMGLVICFGTMMSIVLVVLIMPVSYWQVFKKQNPDA